MVWKWEGGDREPDPYQLEWDDLIAAIRQDKPYNEVERGTMASAVTAMGRMSSHTGQIVKLEDYLEKGVEMAPKVDELTPNSDAPVKADKDGRYPVPEPGRKPTREY